MRRRVDPFDRRSMAFSASLHAVILVLAWASTLYEPKRMDFVTYQIELVSPPPARQAPEPAPAREELVVERPEPEPLPPEPQVEEVVPVEKPTPKPPPPEPPKRTREQPPETAEERVVAATPEPVTAPEANVSGEGLNVRIEGLRRDYPAYYENIIQQIYRCFRWRQGGGWRTTIYFSIDRQGNAHDIEFVSRSGNTAFDIEAMGAVECAGKGRFGPLPADLPYDRFPVRFSFEPIGEDVAVRLDAAWMSGIVLLPAEQARRDR